jgi:hypothetical protein
VPPAQEEPGLLAGGQSAAGDDTIEPGPFSLDSPEKPPASPTAGRPSPSALSSGNREKLQKVTNRLETYINSGDALDPGALEEFVTLASQSATLEPGGLLHLPSPVRDTARSPKQQERLRFLEARATALLGTGKAARLRSTLSDDGEDNRFSKVEKLGSP